MAMPSSFKAQTCVPTSNITKLNATQWYLCHRALHQFVQRVSFSAATPGTAAQQQQPLSSHPVVPMLSSYPVPPAAGEHGQYGHLAEGFEEGWQPAGNPQGNPQGLTKKQLQLEKLRAKNRRSQARYREKCKVCVLASSVILIEWLALQPL